MKRPKMFAAAGRSRTAGISLAEIVITVGVVVTVALGAMEFSQALTIYHFLTSAASQASHFATLRGADCSGFPSACPATAADIRGYVRDLTPEGINPGQVRVTTTWLPNNRVGSQVKVTVGYDYDLDIPFFPDKKLPLSSSAQKKIWR